MCKKLVPFFIASFAIMICSQAYGQGGFGEADANQDDKVDAKELEEYVSGKLPGFDQFETMFSKLDADKDGGISEQEFENRMTVVRELMSQPEETDEPKDEKKPKTRKRTPRPPGLQVGEVAPIFKLKSLDGESETDLAAFKGKKPVVLIFGSYT